VPCALQVRRAAGPCATGTATLQRGGATGPSSSSHGRSVTWEGERLSRRSARSAGARVEVPGGDGALVDVRGPGVPVHGFSTASSRRSVDGRVTSLRGRHHPWRTGHHSRALRTGRDRQTLLFVSRTGRPPRPVDCLGPIVRGRAAMHDPAGTGRPMADTPANLRESAVVYDTYASLDDAVELARLFPTGRGARRQRPCGLGCARQYGVLRADPRVRPLAQLETLGRHGPRQRAGGAPLFVAGPQPWRSDRARVGLAAGPPRTVGDRRRGARGAGPGALRACQTGP